MMMSAYTVYIYKELSVTFRTHVECLFISLSFYEMHPAATHSLW